MCDDSWIAKSFSAQRLPEHFAGWYGRNLQITHEIEQRMRNETTHFLRIQSRYGKTFDWCLNLSRLAGKRLGFPPHFNDQNSALLRFSASANTRGFANR